MTDFRTARQAAGFDLASLSTRVMAPWSTLLGIEEGRWRPSVALHKRISLVLGEVEYAAPNRKLGNGYTVADIPARGGAGSDYRHPTDRAESVPVSIRDGLGTSAELPALSQTNTMEASLRVIVPLFKDGPLPEGKWRHAAWLDRVRFRRVRARR